MEQQKNNKVAIVVDPFSSGKLLVHELKRHNIDCIAVLSNGVPDFQRHVYDKQNYLAELHFDGDVQAMAEQVAPYQPGYIFCGLETGVELADRLAALIGLQGNDPRTSAGRQNKFDTQEVVRQAGLAAPEQLETGDEAELEAWLGHHNQWPVIIKPANSAGSDNVRLCHSWLQVQAAFRLIVGERNLLGLTNQSVLVQEYLRGQEFVVDTVSCAGEHYITNLCRYNKQEANNSAFVYRHVAFMSPAREGMEKLKSYALEVLDALGFDYGPAHLEIMLTERGPVLIEVNARMHGGDVPKVVEHCSPCSQLGLAVASQVAPDDFRRYSQQDNHYHNELVALFLIATESGKVESVVDEAALESVPSVLFSHIPVVGEHIDKTISLNTAAGLIWLLNEDREQLMRDLDKLVQWELQGELFSVFEK